MSDSRVLLLDDDPLILQAYQRSLRRRFDVETAEGPREGLAKLTTSPYAVVVADMLMPGLTGLEVLQQLREVSPHTVGILMTGMGDYEQALEAINRGIVYRFLTKPCALNLLVRSIEDSLQYHRLLTQNDTVHPLLRALADHQARLQPETFPLGGLVRQLAESLQLPQPDEFEAAAHLCTLGQTREGELYQSLASLPHLSEILEMASLAPTPWGERLPEDLLQAPRNALGAHLLELARFCAQSRRSGASPLQTLQQLRERGNHFHPAALACLANLTL